MNKKSIFKNKFYTHLDIKKKYENYLNCISNPKWIESHGFYPFIHYKIVFEKYTLNKETGKNFIKNKERDIFYSSHIDRFIYQYYGDKLNDLYNKISIETGIGKVATAYRNNLFGKCNIHFSREALEFIVKSRKAFIFVGDFTSFFDNLDHKYLKEKLKQVLKTDRLNNDYFAVFKNITKFTYVEREDIEKVKGKKNKELRKEVKYFNTRELREFKKEYIKRNNNYGIPQGSSISSVFSNIYMIEFDKRLNDYVTSNRGMYRRYCDDLIIIIPMEENQIDQQIYAKHIKKIDHIRGCIPRLTLNLDKTEQFYYNKDSDKKLVNLKDDKHILDYLGFSFDGEFVRIREKSIFKYYCRAYKKVRSYKNNKGQINEHAIKKSLFRLYTHLGDKKYNTKEYGNFLTYARKSEEIFCQSKYLHSKINSQVKRHWNKINKKLNE